MFAWQECKIRWASDMHVSPSNAWWMCACCDGLCRKGTRSDTRAHRLATLTLERLSLIDAAMMFMSTCLTTRAKNVRLHCAWHCSMSIWWMTLLQTSHTQNHPHCLSFPSASCSPTSSVPSSFLAYSLSCCLPCWILSYLVLTIILYNRLLCDN